MRGDEWLEMVSRLPDEALGAELARLAGSCRSTTAALIAHLAEFDARRLHLSAGFRSLFRYCTDRLRLSEHAAYNRIEAAHLARRYPQVIDRIEEGSLNLTTVRLAVVTPGRERASHTAKPGSEDYDAGQRDSHAGPRGKRHVPAAIKRAVWLRDCGRCAFVARNGRRCDARALIEFHHVDPYAVGGAATMDNIQLRCRAHNAYEADLFYGRREPTSVQAP